MTTIDPAQLSLIPAVAVFLSGAAVIAIVGVRMTRVAGELASRSGMGEAVMGALFIGGSTSLSGIIASITAAAHGHAELAVSNALGGIAAQTVFLAVADLVYRRANLEHAAASAENLLMAAFLLTLLSVMVVAFVLPDVALWGVHPASLVLIVGYVFGVRLIARTHHMPMWLPRHTRDTQDEKKPETRRRSTGMVVLWLRFLLQGLIVGLAGWLLSRTAVTIASHTGLSEGVVGGVFTAVSTSLPELVVAITAVRMGALTLAVGDIIGGNAFDTLFVAMSDIAYRQGPIYTHVSGNEPIWLALVVLVT